MAAPHCCKEMNSIVCISTILTSKMAAAAAWQQASRKQNGGTVLCCEAAAQYCNTIIAAALAALARTALRRTKQNGGKIWVFAYYGAACSSLQQPCENLLAHQLQGMRTARGENQLQGVIDWRGVHYSERLQAPSITA